MSSVSQYKMLVILNSHVLHNSVNLTMFFFMRATFPRICEERGSLLRTKVLCLSNMYLACLKGIIDGSLMGTLHLILFLKV